MLTGFESAEEAERAAGAAYDALRAWAARQRRTALAPRRGRALRAERDGPRTRLSLGGVQIGRIIGPDDGGPRAAGYSFELLLPPGLGPGARTSAARVVGSALAHRAALRRLERAAQPL